jgi:hypothetical protein
MADDRPNAALVLDRLSRRGNVTIKAEDGTYAVTLAAPGPYRGRAWCTSDEADLYEHCRFGAKSWHGEGNVLGELLATCETESRPERRHVDDIVWAVQTRRSSRTYGPPLPTYLEWRGWRPGQDRWLRTFSHAHEYLLGYMHDVGRERHHETRWRTTPAEVPT